MGENDYYKRWRKKKEWVREKKKKKAWLGFDLVRCCCIDLKRAYAFVSVTEEEEEEKESEMGESREEKIEESVASVLEEAKGLQDSVAGHISKSLSDEHPLRQRALALDSKILSLRSSLDSLLNNKLINHSVADKVRDTLVVDFEFRISIWWIRFVLLQLDEDLQRARCIVVDGDASSLLPGHAHG